MICARKIASVVAFFAIACYWAQGQPVNRNLYVSVTNKPGAFALVAGSKASSILIDSTETSVVKIAAACFQKDIQLVTGLLPALKSQKGTVTAPSVIIGTLGQSLLIDKLVKTKKLAVDSIRGKWEAFSITLLDQAFKGAGKVLCIVGSDPRGTAFGVFEMSKMMGVSPWYWWADVTPEPKKAIYIAAGKSIVQSPSVQYRGIFINDEDWGIQPWAARHMDTAIKDMGPNTYAHIFELLLRLKANYIWPAMHPCTKAFYYYPDNAKVADAYGIVVGTSHCEPMLRNNVFEWAENYKHEYGNTPGEWRYDLNKGEIYTYWADRIKAVKKLRKCGNSGHAWHTRWKYARP